MMICNFCKKEIKKVKSSEPRGVNIEISTWENIRDGDCLTSDILIRDLHERCAEKIIERIKQKGDLKTIK